MPRLRCPVDGRFLRAHDWDNNYECSKCGQKYHEGALGELELLVEPPSAERPAAQAADRGAREGGRTLLRRAAEATARCARVGELELGAASALA